MRSLTSTLLAAQQASSQPYVKAVFSDFHGDISRIRLNRHYTGSEGEYFSAACVAGDGSLIRARIDPTTKVMYTQRVVSPAPGSTYSSWTSQGTVSAVGAVALAAAGSSVLLFYVDTDTLTIKLKASSDNGASYGAAATVATAASAVTYLAAAIAAGGDRVLFWSVGATVWKSRYSGGSWGTPAAWSNSVTSISGLACGYLFDWNVIVCGKEATTSDAKVWACVYGDGVVQAANTWSALHEVTTATSGSGVTFMSPALALLQSWRLFFVEKYTGSLAYSRLQWSTMGAAQDFVDELWREPAAFNYGGDYGMAATWSQTGYLWLSLPAGVWSGLSPANPDLEVTADVMDAGVTVDGGGALVRLILRNDPKSDDASIGRYSGYGSGDLGSLRRGERLQLAPGYYGSAGTEGSTGPGYWVESVQQVTGPSACLVVQARDAWWLLEQWRARRQFSWAAGSKAVSQLLSFVCARAGLDNATVSSSAALTALKPAFTIHPGESGKTAVLRLLAMVPDLMLTQSGTLLSLYPQASDAVEYAYGDDHAIVSGRYQDIEPTSNRVRVLGSGVYNEGFDFAEIETTTERIEQVIDLNLTSTGQAGDRAAADLRKAGIQARRDELLLAGVNCGQELYDVVSVTDAQAGLSDAPRRVTGLSWRYSTGLAPGAGHPRYDMTLALGNP